MDKVNFQGRTVLVTSPQRYAERLQSINGKSSCFTNNANMKHGVSKICEINDGDLFVLVHNGDDGTLRRIEYDRQLGAKDFINNIREDIQNFSKDLKDNITCMILGGRSRDSVTTKCVNDIADGVESFLAGNNQKGDVSIICGVTDELKAPIFVDYTRSLKAPEIYMPAKIEGEVSPEKLEDIFDIVELSNVEFAP